MKNPWPVIKDFITEHFFNPSLEAKPYRDWQTRLSLFFVILALVFLGHYLLYREFLDRSEASLSGGLDQTTLTAEWQNFKIVYARYDSRTQALNDLLAKPAARVDPGR